MKVPGTIEQIQVELRKIDPIATITSLFHDEVTVECTEAHSSAVAKRLSELLYVTDLRMMDFIDTAGEPVVD